MRKQLSNNQKIKQSLHAFDKALDWMLSNSDIHDVFLGEGYDEEEASEIINRHHGKLEIDTPSLRQAMAVLASIMRFGNSEGSNDQDIDYLNGDNSFGDNVEYVQFEWDELLQEHSDLFDGKMTEQQLQKEIKGE